jgi:hypothetical protein
VTDHSACLTAAEVLARGGPALTFRRLDYWTKTGHVTGHRHATGELGSGVPRWWTPQEAHVAEKAAAISVETGIPPVLAVALARGGGMVDTGRFAVAVWERPS